MNPWKAGAAWIVLLALATTLTWQIVSFADSQVSARPVEIEVSPTSVPGDSTTTSLAITSTTELAPTTSSPSATTPTTTGQNTTSTSDNSSTSTTSSAPDAEWNVRTIATAGGTVVVRHRPEEVELQAATPAPGFQMEIDDSGPDRVRVEFENDDTDIRVDVEWKSGNLEVEISD